MDRIGKKELINKIANATNLPKKEIQAVVEAAINTIVEEVKNGNEIALKRFGTFKEKINKPKEGRNPQTKEKIQIPGSKTIAFKASSSLKEPL